MTNTMLVLIRKRLGLLIPFGMFILIFSGCASQQEIMARKSVERAKAAYAEAAAKPDVKTLAPIPLTDAARLIQSAEQTKDFKEMEHLGYLAEKKSQTAMTIAEGKAGEKEVESLSKEASDVLIQKRVLEATLAKTQAEVRAREAEQSRLMSREEVEKAKKARAEAEARAREAEVSRQEAEARARETEKARMEAVVKALEAEKSRLMTREEVEKAERARTEAEVRAREAEQSRQEAEARARETEKARGEAEARAREAEQSRLMTREEVEKARKARTEAEAKAQEAEQARLLALAEAHKAEKLKIEAEARAKEAELARLGALAEAEKARKTRAETDQLLKDFSELRARQTERGIVLTMGDLLFAFNESTLLTGATRTIEKVVDYLQKNPTRNILIEGFTDSIGSDSYNITLSQKRADSVKDALTAKGVSMDRITTKGYGKQFPIASNDNSGGRQLNRRVEILILNEGVKPETMLRQ